MLEQYLQAHHACIDDLACQLWCVATYVAKAPASGLLDARVKFFQACHQSIQCPGINNSLCQCWRVPCNCTQTMTSSFFVEAILRCKGVHLRRSCDGDMNR
jgi:hypothetical protein